MIIRWERDEEKGRDEQEERGRKKRRRDPKRETPKETPKMTSRDVKREKNEEILHFLAELFGHVKKKSYLCMLFRDMPCLTRTYVR